MRVNMFASGAARRFSPWLTLALWYVALGFVTRVALWWVVTPGPTFRR